ncbi:hypothetical protein WJX81_007075 [Elliptochloris bilobata]|uniref:ceramide glucosyltransferase n=1 Tax=Elliptochloris bilobata TaxID=381761 RepID=A0AAW1S706_9CHLO
MWTLLVKYNKIHPYEDMDVICERALLNPVGQSSGLGSIASARIVTAPHATRCSQKIANLQALSTSIGRLQSEVTCILSSPLQRKAGVRAARPGHKWVLCLDDDIELHPRSLADLVAAAEADPAAFMATGYPLDIPPPGAGLLTYAVLVYHLPLLIGFSLRARAAFVWGGCMLLPLAHLRADTYGIMAAWEHGGYSDDLIVAAQCNRHGLRILCPAFALFPQWLDGTYSPTRYWNYLRRQLYVMDTYACAAARRTNHAMLALHACLSWAFVAPAVLAALQSFVAAGWLLQGSKAGSYLEGGCARANAALAVYAAACAVAHCALVWMTSVVLELFAALSPGAPALRARDFTWPRLWVGFLLNNAALPVAAVATLALPGVVWSGVRYRKRGGRVVRVERLAA